MPNLSNITEIPCSPIPPFIITKSPFSTFLFDKSLFSFSIIPIPEVFINILSPFPFSTTFVSPVTIFISHSSDASFID